MSDLFEINILRLHDKRCYASASTFLLFLFMM